MKLIRQLKVSAALLLFQPASDLNIKVWFKNYEFAVTTVSCVVLIIKFPEVEIYGQVCFLLTHFIHPSIFHTCLFLLRVMGGWGRKPEHLGGKPRQMWGEHANFTQKEPRLRLKPTTFSNHFILQSVNHWGGWGSQRTYGFIIGENKEAFWFPFSNHFIL